MKELHHLQLVFFFHLTTLRHFMVDFSVNSFYCLLKRLLSTYLKRLSAFLTRGLTLRVLVVKLPGRKGSTHVITIRRHGSLRF